MISSGVDDEVKPTFGSVPNMAVWDAHIPA